MRIYSTRKSGNVKMDTEQVNKMRQHNEYVIETLVLDLKGIIR